MKCATSAEEYVQSVGGTLHCGSFPNSSKVSSARLMTPSGDNNGFHNQTNVQTVNKVQNFWLHRGFFVILQPITGQKRSVLSPIGHYAYQSKSE